MGGPVVREATGNEWETVAALIRATFEEDRGWLDPPSGALAETAESLRRLPEGSGAFLALEDGLPIGCVVYRFADDHLELSRLSVRPDQRGRGVGKALVARVEDRARALGRPRVRLGVRVVLDGLRAFCARRGYRPVEGRSHAGFAAPTYLIFEKDVEGSPGPPRTP
jgi:GNAT superfamily N-acetyltransferase